MTTRLPTTVVARLLSTQVFTSILEKTFQWLYKQAQTTICSKFVLKPAQSPQRPLSRESSSSITVQEGLSTNLKRSKKRKREQKGSSTYETDTFKLPDIYALHFSICSAVKQLETRTIEISSGSDEFAAEHMKAALKTTVKQCSRILGGFFESLNGVLETFLDGAQDEKNDKEADISENLTQPMVELWTLRSSPLEDIPGLLSAVRIQCFPLVYPNSQESSGPSQQTVYYLP